MARYKVIKFGDSCYKLNKKRDRIRKAVDAIYMAFLFIGILICGINQFNSLIVGWGMIIMGIFSLPVAIFHIYIDINGWEPLFWYDKPEFKKYVNRSIKEEDLSEYRVIRVIEKSFFILASVVLPILGILRLFGIM